MAEKRNNILPPEQMERQYEYIKLIKRDNDGYFSLNGSRRRACVMTFGCQQNEADSEKISGMAEAMGYEMSNTPDGASLIVVNTCAIREHAEQKALSIIGQYKHIKAAKPEMLIGVCGCMVTQEHRKESI